jgi:benzoyl-CoA reductase/2-hydroxyglutaryl-CoA dehydratase subunit BcrC/BadD/HgdB
LATRYATDITEAKLIQAIQLMNRERDLRRQLADLMTLETPPLTGRQLLDFKSNISGIEADLQQYEHALQRYGQQNGGAHIPNHVSRFTSHASPVRVLLTGVPLAHGAERVLELIESAGAVVVCMENCTGLKPILEDVDLASEPDPIRAIAKKYYHLPCSVMTPNTRRFESLRALSAKFRPQCVIELVWQACLTYDVESLQVRKLVEEELHLPYLKITTDYSPSDSARITARVEALFETVRAKVG